MPVHTAAVTGANSGIGKEITCGLLKAGFRVIMMCRNMEKAEAAKKELMLKTQPKMIDIVQVDLASIKDIKRASEEILDRFNRLDVLVNNAGIFSSESRYSKDGYELTFAVNHLAIQYLSERLIPLLKQSATKTHPSRIVNVSSEAHRRGKINSEDLMLEKKFSGMAAYSQSKLGNILHTRYLAPKLVGDNILINCCHPGVVATNFAADEGGVFGFVFSFFRWFMISPSDGAKTPLMLAIGPLVEPKTGQYYSKQRVKNPNSVAKDSVVAETLFETGQLLIEKALHSTVGVDP